VNREWATEIENLSADWQRALYKSATTQDPDLREIYEDLAACSQAKVQFLRKKLNRENDTQH
jgi:hypothetical protein